MINRNSNNSQHCWLAIGDETGSWDFETTRDGKRGLVLILARTDAWQGALKETIAGQSVAKRMAQPLQHLPGFSAKSTFHHALDAFKLGPDGLSQELHEELRQNLGWLAGHQQLMTLGFHASHAELYQRLTHSQDATCALAKAYAALVALVLPFLGQQDELLLGFGPRSENLNTVAATRSGLQDALNTNNRAEMDSRRFLSTLRDSLIGNLNRVWPNGGWDKRFQAKVLGEAVRDARVPYAPKSTWDGLADLGASLLYVQQNAQWAELFALGDRPNVHFGPLKEYLR